MWVSRRKHDALVLEIDADRERMRRERDAARKQLRAEQAARTTMARQIDDLTEQLAQAHAELDQPGGRRLERCERARASLDAHLRQVQQSAARQELELAEARRVIREQDQQLAEMQAARPAPGQVTP